MSVRPTLLLLLQHLILCKTLTWYVIAMFAINLIDQRFTRSHSTCPTSLICGIWGVGGTMVSTRAFHLCDPGLIHAQCRLSD